MLAAPYSALLLTPFSVVVCGDPVDAPKRNLNVVAAVDPARTFFRTDMNWL